jgi:hypothetical protein
MIKVKLNKCFLKLHLRVLCLEKSYPMEIEHKDFEGLLRENVKPIVFDLDVNNLMSEHA